MHLSLTEISQLNTLKNKSPSERFSLMISLIDIQMEAMKTGIRHYHPNIDEGELLQCLKDKMMIMYSLKPLSGSPTN